uniref:Uncharacterized protein n=1 Tax=Timema bartmani TaxID=61472 RepID=A0A7R9ESZ8_9NEOP|nr:unnamed protein product [Timema bartmani]
MFLSVGDVTLDCSELSTRLTEILCSAPAPERHGTSFSSTSSAAIKGHGSRGESTILHLTDPGFYTLLTGREHNITSTDPGFYTLRVPTFNTCSLHNGGHDDGAGGLARQVEIACRNVRFLVHRPLARSVAGRNDVIRLAVLRTVRYSQYPLNHIGETPNLDSNLDLPVIGSLVHCESSALDHSATERVVRSKVEAKLKQRLWRFCVESLRIQNQESTASYYPFGLYA